MTNLSQRQRERDWKREKKREREHGLDRLRKAMDIFSVSSIDEVSVRVHLRRPSQRQLELFGASQGGPETRGRPGQEAKRRKQGRHRESVERWARIEREANRPTGKRTDGSKTKSMDSCTRRLISYKVIDRVARDCKAIASYQRHVWMQKCAAVQPDPPSVSRRRHSIGMLTHFLGRGLLVPLQIACLAQLLDRGNEKKIERERLRDRERQRKTRNRQRARERERERERETEKDRDSFRERE